MKLVDVGLWRLLCAHPTFSVYTIYYSNHWKVSLKLARKFASRFVWADYATANKTNTIIIIIIPFYPKSTPSIVYSILVRHQHRNIMFTRRSKVSLLQEYYAFKVCMCMYAFGGMCTTRSFDRNCNIMRMAWCDHMHMHPERMREIPTTIVCNFSLTLSCGFFECFRSLCGIICAASFNNDLWRNSMLALIGTPVRVHWLHIIGCTHTRMHTTLYVQGFLRCNVILAPPIYCRKIRCNSHTWTQNRNGWVLITHRLLFVCE